MEALGNLIVVVGTGIAIFVLSWATVIAAVSEAV